jgi:polyisoprenoid-binding protein YceI
MRYTCEVNFLEVNEMSTTELQTTAIPTGSYDADRVHSSVAFEVEYMGIGAFGGTVSDFDAELRDGRLTGVARIATIEVKDENLHAHLLSPEFFDAERHPEVSFTTDRAESDGRSVRFEGEITIKGVSRRATLTGTITGPSTDQFGNERIGLELETTVDRTAFGITWNADLPNGTKALADEVTLRANLSLVKAG